MCVYLCVRVCVCAAVVVVVYICVCVCCVLVQEYMAWRGISMKILFIFCCPCIQWFKFRDEKAKGVLLYVLRDFS